MQNIREKITTLAPWHQKLFFSEDVVSPGKWDCQKQYSEIIRHIEIARERERERENCT